MHIFEEMVRGKIVTIRGEVWRFDDAARLLSPSDPAPGDPCWCFSGRSFDSCHLPRDQQPLISQAEFLAGWETSADIEMCLHPEAPVGCSPKIVHAHTVQRMGGGLKRLAVDGEVYGMPTHPFFIQKNGGWVIPQKIGLKKASTFRGFCESHDAALFRPAETKPFTASEEQLTLLNFRAVARRVYGREVAVRHTNVMFGYDRGLPPYAQRIYFAIQEDERLRAMQTLANIRELKKLYDGRISNGDFSGINAFVIVFDGAPEIAFAEIVRIDVDFIGATLKDPDPPAHLVVYTVAIDNGWAFVAAWLGPNSAAEDLCRSFAARLDEEKSVAALRYAVEYVDNLFFSPAWWNGLSQENQHEIIRALTSRMHPLYVRHPAVLEANRFAVTNARYLGSFAIGPWSVTASAA